MKRFSTLTAICLLLLTACNPTPTSEGLSLSSSANTSSFASTPSTESQTLSSSVDMKGSLVTESAILSTPNSDQVNTAVSILYPEYSPQKNSLFYTEELGMRSNVPWQRLNQISQLERANYTFPTSEDYDYEEYFVITPTHVGSHIRIYSMKLLEESPYIVRDELIYENLDSPDDYAIILTSLIPDISYHYEVSVEYEDREATYAYSYNGKGDYDPIQEIVA